MVFFPFDTSGRWPSDGLQDSVQLRTYKWEKKKKKEFRYIGKCPNVPALTRHLQEEHHFQCFIFSGNKQSRAPQFLQKLELWAGLPTSSACDRRMKYTQLYWKQNALVHNAVVDYSSFRHCQMQDLCIWQKSFFFFPSRKQKLSWVRKNNIPAVDAIKQSTPKALIKWVWTQELIATMYLKQRLESNLFSEKLLISTCWTWKLTDG